MEASEVVVWKRRRRENVEGREGVSCVLHTQARAQRAEDDDDDRLLIVERFEHDNAVLLEALVWRVDRLVRPSASSPRNMCVTHTHTHTHV